MEYQLLLPVTIFFAFVAFAESMLLYYLSNATKSFKSKMNHLERIIEQLTAKNEQLKKENEPLSDLKKKLFKSKKELSDIRNKYDFMRTNVRKFNVGDIVGKLEIKEVDVKVPSILDDVITLGRNLVRSFFNKREAVPFKKPEFIYKVKQSESWFTESQLENHSNSTPITKRKYKKRTTKKQVKPKN